ncbi:MAG TPA: NUDIX domain-containing protein [Kineosporiaceae bacterium]|nr:NUDIX domain-containing protein [Kineosporiaceae bacterium]
MTSHARPAETGREHPTWTPGEELVADVRHTLALAPRDTAEDRFEAWAWRALLDEDGGAVLTRQAAPSHLTASAIVLSPDGLRTCLVLHRRMGLWVQPGGHFEEGDHSVREATAREVAEETGLSGEILQHPVALSRHRAPCRPEVVDWHLDIQCLLVAPDATPVVSHESRDVTWFDLRQLPSDLATGVEANVARAVRLLARS